MTTETNRSPNPEGADAGLLPRQPPVESDPDDPLVARGTEETATVCGALTSETATRLLAALAEEPTVASRLAERLDTSIQNVRYHLERLREAEVIEVVGTWYSSRGREMDVYAPAGRRIVLDVGAGSDRS